MNPLLQSAIDAGWSRRQFLHRLFVTAGGVATASLLASCGASSLPDAPVTSAPTPAPAPTPDPLPPAPAPAPTPRSSPFAMMGPLQPANADGIMLPAGFTSRVVAVVNQPPIASNPAFLWHSDPDGAGTFRTEDGGWIIVSNAEVRDNTTGSATAGLNPATSRETAEALGQLGGGVSALRFDSSGNLVDAYAVERDTTTNCSGGATPWGTWINGEEIVDGYMFECSPLRDGGPAVRLDRFGRKGHEMVAVDVAGRAIYHTEDAGGDDRFYRNIYTPAEWPTGGRPDLVNGGKLQALAVDAGLDAARAGPTPIRWVDCINDGRPQASVYLPETTVFSGNEGVWYLNGFIYFSTKGDDNIWVIDTLGNTIESLYDPARNVPGSPVDPAEPAMFGVDNICMTLDGEMLVVEDGGDMRCMVLLPDGSTIPLLRLPGEPDVTEVTGPTFSPDGRKLYVAGQRSQPVGAPAAFRVGGVIYEITMPFAVRVDPPMAGRMP